MISKSEWGIEHTGATVKADALKEAGTFCMKQQKDIEVVNTNQQDMVPFKSEAQAEVEFRCHSLWIAEQPKNDNAGNDALQMGSQNTQLSGYSAKMLFAEFRIA